MAKSSISMSGDEIAALEAEELAPADTTPVEPSTSVSDKKGRAEAEPEFVAEPDEDAPKLDAKAKDGKPKKPEAERPRTVPHEALHAEREEHKKTRAQLQTQEIRQARLEERLNAINEAWSRGQQAQQW